MVTPDKTPALVSVIKGNKVLLKIFAGSNGSRIKRFLEDYDPNKRYSLTRVYEIPQNVGLGSKEDLIVMSEGGHHHQMTRTLSSTYRNTFNKPRFHPAVKEGKVDSVHVIKLES